MSAEILTVGGHSLSLLGVGYLTGAVTMVLVGLYPLLSDEPLQESLFFFLFSLAVAVWLFGFGWMLGSPDAGRAVRWLRLAYVGVPIIPAILYTVSIHTLDVADRRRPAVALLWIGSALFLAILSGTDLVVEGLHRQPWGYYPAYSAAGLVFIAFVVSGIGMSLGEYLLRHRHASREEERTRAQRYLLAFGVGSLAVVDFVPAYGVEMYPLGYLFILPMAALIGHTIREYHLTRLTTSFAADRILDTVTDPVLVCDGEGRIRVANPAVEAVFGYRPGDLVGSSFDLLFGETDDASAVPSLLDGDAVRDEEVVLRARSGDPRTASLSATALRDAKGERVGTAVVIRDIRERKSLEAQLRQSQKMQAVGTLAGGVAHDFNNLLTVILGNVDLILEAETDRAVREEAESVRAAARRASDLTRQLLTFSRRDEVRGEILDLNGSVTALERMLSRLLRDDVRLETGTAPVPLPVEADRGQLEQVVVNLVVNAQEAMPGGGRIQVRTGRIELGEEYAASHPDAAPGPHVVLTVSDTGRGMDEETRRRIFEPFFTTREDRGGTGLGLSTVYGIVKQWGGHIGVYSEPGEGTVFKVYLPLHEGERNRCASSESDLELPGSATLLVVEDERWIRKTAERILGACGHRVIPARDPEEALRRIEELDGSVDVVLTEVVMRHLSGPELVRRIRTADPEARAVYISGYTDEEVRERQLVDPADAFLEKPFTREDLARVVRRVLLRR